MELLEESIPSGVEKDPCIALDKRIADLEAALATEREKVRELVEALDCLTAVVGLTPVAGNKAALQEGFDQARAALAQCEQEEGE